MGKLLLAIVVSTFTSIGSSFALANERWYVGASVGSANHKDECSDLGSIGFVGSCDDTDTGW